MIVIIMDFLAV